jgi:two-component system response regulator HupR/HoxA
MPRSQLNPRELRRPFFVPVVTEPAIDECWTENVSGHGLGLICRCQTAPGVGQSMIARFALPDRTDIEARGTVAWVKQAAPATPATAAPTATVSFGLTFADVLDDSTDALARFLAGFRFRVAVVGGSQQQRQRLIEVASDVVSLEFFDHADDVAGFDIACIVGCNDVPRAAAGNALDDAAQRVFFGDLSTLSTHTASSATLVPLTADNTALREAIVDACREWSVRAELRHTTFRFARELAALRTAPQTRPGNDLVADSAAMKQVLRQVGIVAPRKTVVLLEGETGTGKEVLARTVHRLSDRAQRLLVVQDCGTLSDTLLESELFGHVRGAFTGAHADHAGLFVTADGGTVFLDEVENTTPALQAKLLRVLETGEVRPVGGNRTRIVDVRIIAATNTDLAGAVAAGRFRADLFYRLSVFPIPLPALRERGDDVISLARRLIDAAAHSHAVRPLTLDAQATSALLAHRWPGNVRELKNAMERAVLLAAARHSTTISVDDLPASIAAAAGVVTGRETGSLDEQVARFERSLIARSLTEHGGVVGRAATALAVHRVTLMRKIKAHGLQASSSVERVSSS